MGKGVSKAIDNVNNIISDELMGMSAEAQEALDASK